MVVDFLIGGERVTASTGTLAALMINYPYPSIAKFADLVQLKDYRPPTKKEYVRYLRRFADHLRARSGQRH